MTKPSAPSSCGGATGISQISSGRSSSRALRRNSDRDTLPRTTSPNWSFNGTRARSQSSRAELIPPDPVIYAVFEHPRQRHPRRHRHGRPVETPCIRTLLVDHRDRYRYEISPIGLQKLQEGSETILVHAVAPQRPIAVILFLHVF